MHALCRHTFNNQHIAQQARPKRRLDASEMDITTSRYKDFHCLRGECKFLMRRSSYTLHVWVCCFCTSQCFVQFESCVPIVFSISRFVSVWKYLSIIQDLPEFSETISFPMGSLNNSYHTSFPVELNNTSLAEKGRIRLGFDGN